MPTEHDVRAMMLALPEAQEVVVANWGDQPTFRVRKKIFGLVGHGAPRPASRRRWKRRRHCFRRIQRCFW